MVVSPGTAVAFCDYMIEIRGKRKQIRITPAEMEPHPNLNLMPEVDTPLNSSVK